MTSNDLADVLISVCKEYISDGQKLGHVIGRDIEDVLSSLNVVIAATITLSFPPKARNEVLDITVKALNQLKKNEFWAAEND